MPPCSATRLARGAFLALALGSVRAADAQCRLGGLPMAGFGAVGDDRAVIGSNVPEAAVTVRFFDKTRSGWTQVDQAVVGDICMVYPTAVALEGDRALAGSAESNAQIGRAYAFDRVGTSWVATELPHVPSTGGDFFGSAVSLSGDIAVIGADHQPKGGGDGHPLAHVFERRPSGWIETAQIASGGRAQDVDDGTIALGWDRTTPGYVTLHRKVGGVWTQVETLVAPTPPAGPHLGTSVAIEGDVLAAGAAWPGWVGPGRVEIFRRLGGTWQWTQTLLPAASAVGDDFGCALALSERTLLVGSDRAHSGAGRVYRFEDDGTRFVETAAIDPVAPATYFGFAVAVRGEDAILTGWPDVAFYRLGFQRITAFCAATPNSTGAPAELAAQGSDSRACAELALLATRLPPRALALPFFGSTATSAPFGDGRLCVAGTLHRLPASRASASGDLRVELDFGAAPASSIAPGRPQYFQMLYRDVAAGGTGRNLTRALAIGITP